MDSDRMVEQQVQKVPPSLLIGLALGSMVASAAFALGGKIKIANFIGQWVPSLLVLATFDRIVQQGSGQSSSSMGSRASLPNGAIGTSSGLGSGTGIGGSTVGSTRTPGL